MNNRGGGQGRGGTQRGGHGGGTGRGDGGRGGRGTGAGRGNGGRGGRGRGNGGGGGPGGARGRGGAPQLFAAGVPPRIDSRLESADAAVAANLAAAPYDPRRPLRPGFGTLGTATMLRSNFFVVRMPRTPFFEYSFCIEPTVLTMHKRRLLRLLERTDAFAPHVPYVAYDRGARMIAARELPQPLAVPVQYFEDGTRGPHANLRTYTVIITLICEVDFSDLQK
jgi:eukaryotic translation initiation factor 2C